MIYKKTNPMMRKYYLQKKAEAKKGNQAIANKIQIFANAEINKVVENKAGKLAYHEGKAYNNPNTLTELININKPKIDKEYSKLINSPKTSDTFYHQIEVQNRANDQAKRISQAQYEQIQKNIKAVEQVIDKYGIKLEKYRELNEKYPKTISRKGIITESIENKNYITSLGKNIVPHFDGYRELSPLTEHLHRQAQNQASEELARAENEEAIANGQDPPNDEKKWIWTGIGETTRHQSNDGQVVPIDEPFIIVNDATGEVDEMMYPLDPTVYSSNTFICYCEVDYGHFSDNKSEQTLDTFQALNSILSNINNRLNNEITVVPNPTTDSLTNLDFDDIQTPEECAKYFNLNYEGILEEIPQDTTYFQHSYVGDKIEGKVHSFTDPHNENCRIYVYDDMLENGMLTSTYYEREIQTLTEEEISKLPKEEQEELQETIKSTTYELKQFFKDYDDLPEILKSSIDELVFGLKTGDVGGAFIGSYASGGAKGAVQLNRECIGETGFDGKIKDNPRTTLFHEMGHSLAHKLGFGYDKLEYEYGASYIVDTKIYKKARRDDKKLNGDKYATDYGARSKSFEEEQADVTSAVLLNLLKKNDKNYDKYVMYLQGVEKEGLRGNVIYLDEFLERYPNRVKVIKDFLGVK